MFHAGHYVVDLAFVDNIVKNVKYCRGWWAEDIAALLPSGDTGVSYFLVNKRKCRT